MTATLLVEIGVEELPPQAMRALAEAFQRGLAAALAAQGVNSDTTHCFATPRRLAVSLGGVAPVTPETTVEKTGPSVAVAFDDNGRPTAAAQGFARSVGARVDELAREDGAKGERLVYRAIEPGKPLAACLQPCIDAVLKRLPVPKLMRWGAGHASFVRPVHWVVALHGPQVVELEVFGHRADRLTLGHRFHHPQAIALTHADDYLERLYTDGCVMADMDARRARVVEQVQSAATAHGGRAVVEPWLVDEVNALVEWPVGIAGRFDERFLELPREVLVATLQGHQRYFPIEDVEARLVNGFVTVANLQSRDQAQVVAGNERVVRPRLADALFFWEQDRRRGLMSHIDGLARVSFQKGLGTLADKSRRVAALAATIAPAAGADPATVARAATLAKTDLLTEMVGEFPELQGVMGRYYALDAGESQAVAEAIESHYRPIRAGGDTAGDAAGQVLAIADRLDSVAGIFAIGRPPTGDKDPFALRRAALGVLRTAIERNIALDLKHALAQAIAGQPVAAAAETATALWMFHMERLRGYYAEQDVPADCFEAVAALEVTCLTDFDRRVQALSAFSRSPEMVLVGAAHKRIRNILQQDNDDAPPGEYADAEASPPAEKALAAASRDHREAIEQATGHGDYRQALERLTGLAAPLDRFFDEVMVMADDSGVRRNRLALLADVDRLCRAVADISRLTP